MTLDINIPFQVDPANPQILNFLNQDDGGWYDVLLAVAPDSSISGKPESLSSSGSYRASSALHGRR